jgi:hypothetical protein
MYRLWQNYWYKKDLVAHKNAAHDMSEFRGKECSSVFGYETALKRHVRSKHEGKRLFALCAETLSLIEQIMCVIWRPNTEMSTENVVFLPIHRDSW